MLEYGQMAKETKRDARKDRKEPETHTRAEFFRNLKKVVKKRERPSQSHSEKR